MRLQGREISPTRATAMALREEEKLIREGYEFLDEKRVLLAQQLLKELENYRTAKGRFQDAQADALKAVYDAAGRHGLEELSVYPPPYPEGPAVKTGKRNFLGLKLIEVDVDESLEIPEPAEDAPSPAFPSIEAETCAKAFRTLTIEAAKLATVRTNLSRLEAEYRATERRARALENVLLPETNEAIKAIDEHLEAAEQEEAMMVRHVKDRR